MQSNQSQGSFYSTSDQEYDQNSPGVLSDQSVDWEASEYIQHEKGAGWLILVILVAVALIALTIFFKQWTFAVLIAVAAVTFGYFGFRKPQVVHYHLSNKGVMINNNPYSFKDFRAFGVREEGAFYSVMLIPVKRLSPAVNLYFAEEQAEVVMAILGDHLPVEKLNPDPFDTIMRRLRF